MQTRLCYVMFQRVGDAVGCFAIDATCGTAFPPESAANIICS